MWPWASYFPRWTSKSTPYNEETIQKAVVWLKCCKGRTSTVPGTEKGSLDEFLLRSCSRHVSVCIFYFVDNNHCSLVSSKAALFPHCIWYNANTSSDRVKKPRRAQGSEDLGVGQGRLPPSDFEDNRFGITTAGLDGVRLGPNGRQW